MTRFLPIPRKDLPHRAVLVRGDESAWETGGGEEVELVYVRVQGERGFAWTQRGEQGAHALILFYDCVSSRPRGLDFRCGDRIWFDGREYAVRAAQAVATDGLAGSDSVHHWEVTLG